MSKYGTIRHISLILLLTALLFPLATLHANEKCALDILLTNDDGWEAPGIRAVRQALLGAGHRVTLVAPLQQQSGRGGAMNTAVGQQVAVVEQSEGLWSVDGTPTDSVRAALDVVLRDRRPDLVVSGSNFGPNLGQEGVHTSGTLGAALTAHYEGIPAIAISTGIRVDERDSEPPFKSTLAAFPASANVVARLIDLMTSRHGCEAIMPGGMVLNVNVPVPVESIRGVRYAPLAKQNQFRMHWQPGETAGTARIAYRQADPAMIGAGSDVELFQAGFVTVSPISGDTTLGALPASLGLPPRLTELLPGDGSQP